MKPATHLPLLLLLTAVLFPRAATAASSDYRGTQFRSWTNFTAFSRLTNQQGALVLLSPRIVTPHEWDQMIPSWNMQPGQGVRFRLEARAFCGKSPTTFYNFGRWTLDPGRTPARSSETAQTDALGRVDTDTLVLNRPAKEVELRLTFPNPAAADQLQFLALSFLDTRFTRPPSPSDVRRPGRTIPVPERSQMPYLNGEQLCSPAAVSMLLVYWSEKLHRPDLDRTVPQVADGVWDYGWGGTGNWSFNMAFAGAMPGMRAWVVRLNDLAEVEEWIDAGVPVALSVCYNALRGKPGPPSGHLVVCVGFTESGDPVVNDPGTSRNVRKVFPRANLIKAWANSRQAAYLVYPVSQAVPPPWDGTGSAQ